MKYKVVLANSFVKDLERVMRQKKDIAELDKVVLLLQSGEKLLHATRTIRSRATRRVYGSCISSRTGC